MQALPVSLPRLDGWCAALALAASLAGCASAPPPVPALPPTPSVPSAPSIPAPAAAVPPAVAHTEAPVPAPADPAQGFARWVDAFRATARAAGITETTLHLALDGVRYLPRVVELDRAQPEFTRTVWAYLDNAVSATRVARGQDKLLQVRAEADAAATRYGVPAPILVAIWGMESNYGSNYGDIATLDALATLGFEGRREDWARGQLIAALKIIQNGDIDPAHMIGSWPAQWGRRSFCRRTSWPTRWTPMAMAGATSGAAWPT